MVEYSPVYELSTKRRCAVCKDEATHREILPVWKGDEIKQDLVFYCEEHRTTGADRIKQ